MSASFPGTRYLSSLLAVLALHLIPLPIRANESSPPKLTLDRRNDGMLLTVHGRVGTRHQLEQASTLSGGGDWLELRSITITNNPEVILDRIPGAEVARFYRLREINDPPPDWEQEIRDFLQRMEQRAEARDVAGFLDLFANDFVHFGDILEDMDGLVAAIPTVRTFDWNISRITISVETKTAQVHGTVTVGFDGGGSRQFEEPLNEESPGFGWLRRTDNGWKIHGNQQRAEVSVATGLVGGSHQLRVTARGDRFPMSSVTVSGPFIAATSLAPDPTYGGFTVWITPSARPPVGTSYRFEVQYADNTRQTLESPIHSYVELDASPIQVSMAGGTATISWRDIMPQVPNASGYWVWVYDQDGHRFTTDDDDYLQTHSLTVTAADLGFPLVRGRQYSVNVYLFNDQDDFSEAITHFTVP
ncbi:MAG: nuclear transport factor 2 family protein [Verrucomicrobiales bacterium]|nr:nuclear transport factor 2 family protein [Verrucomicrobiales bacterium]